jgi:hypothetical protein
MCDEAALGDCYHVLCGVAQGPHRGFFFCHAIFRNAERKFIFVETAYFYRWWVEQSPASQQQVHGLFKSGQIEFVNGYVRVFSVEQTSEARESVGLSMGGL